MMNNARSARKALILSLAVACTAVALADVPAGAQQPRPQPPAQKAPAQPAAAPLAGVWIDHTGRGAIEVHPCPGNGGHLCGRIVWLDNPNDKQGKPLRDILNPDTKLRGQPICGLQVIGNVRQQRDGSYDGGWIYDPEEGAKYDVELRLKDASTLQVMGYIGVKWLSETYTWKRAPQEVKRCSA